MTYLFIWWFLLLLLGVAALPITMRFLRFLPDKGYAFAKPLGLLIWVYPFWLLAVFGFIRNSFGALAIILVIVAGASWAVLRGRGEDSIIAWLRAHWRYVLVVELVFAVTLAAFAYFRAFNPEISATEKPMEFMFLNSILQSSNFPPRDAWMSGFAISYYYLGYVVVAALARLGQVPSGYAFNLGLIMTYALTAVGAFGLIFNVVSHALTGQEPARNTRSLAPYVFGIIAVFLFLVIGNLQGVVEVAYNYELGSREFYAGLNLHGIEQVDPSGNGIPQDNWWWWRASRVLNDISPDGGHIEVIDEFPAFSFLLGDLHPHVLSLPFCVLALALALNILLTSRTAPTIPEPESPNPVTSSESGGESLISYLQSLRSTLLTPRMLLTALIVGSLGMLNTWDIVTYGVVIAAAFAIAQYGMARNFSLGVLIRSGAFLAAMFVGGYLLFLPFYLGFASQARGVLPQLTKTPIHQYLIMFGFFIFILVCFVAVLISQQRSKRGAFIGMAEFAIPLLSVPLVIALGGVVAIAFLPAVSEQIVSLLRLDPNNPISDAARVYFGALLQQPWVFVLLVLLISGIAALGRLELTSPNGPGPRTAVVFALLLALMGLILTFGTEFLFIRDGFGSRMNTVFKLYYQAWLLLAMAATFGAFYIWHTSGIVVRTVWVGAFAILFALSMVYSVLAYPNRANYFNAAQTPPTLDGWQWVERSFPDDYAGIQWVSANVPPTAVILEAAGDPYSFDSRVSTATGVPTVLGWGGHEEQWRGTRAEIDPRIADIEQIYKARSLDITRELLDKYSIDYVIVGSIERRKYQLNSSLVDKFGRLGEMVFDQGTMRIYRVGDVSVSFQAP